MLESISINQLKDIKDALIIDIRNLEKYNDNHILNALNIPFEQLIINYSKYLNKEKKYYIYCQRGIKSRKICLMLKQLGYNVININGGYEAWILNQ